MNSFTAFNSYVRLLNATDMVRDNYSWKIQGEIKMVALKS